MIAGKDQKIQSIAEISESIQKILLELDIINNNFGNHLDKNVLTHLEMLHKNAKNIKDDIIKMREIMNGESWKKK